MKNNEGVFRKAADEDIFLDFIILDFYIHKNKNVIRDNHPVQDDNSDNYKIIDCIKWMIEDLTPGIKRRSKCRRWYE